MSISAVRSLPNKPRLNSRTNGMLMPFGGAICENVLKSWLLRLTIFSILPALICVLSPMTISISPSCAIAAITTNSKSASISKSMVTYRSS